jgi:hypothetical protein
MRSNRRNYWGTITARSVEPTGTPPSVDPLLCRYTARADEQATSDDGRVSLVLTNHLPIRRISSGANIIPAEVGDPCLIQVRGSKVFLWAITEGVPFAEACT